MVSAILGGIILIHKLEFSFQLRKSTENLGEDCRVLIHHLLADVTVILWTDSVLLFGISPPRLPVCDISQPLVGTSAFLVISTVSIVLTY